MAEAAFNNPESSICQYFRNSICRYGDKCRFSHRLSTPPRRETCKFYLRGKCRFGDKCWNRHHSVDDPSLDPAPKLCTDFIAGHCPAGYACDLMHGDPCPECGKPCLNPLDPGQRRQHEAACERESRARADASKRRGADKSCGICLEVVSEKADPTRRKFGVLENCNHVFCFECIMQWRKVKGRDLEAETRNTCPECRTPSDFVAPTKIWFSSKEEKRRLLSGRRAHLATKHCRSFRRGRGHCPHGSLCFYLHVLPNGQKVSLPPPDPLRQELDFVSRLLMLDFWDHADDLFSSDSDFEEELDDLDLLYNLDFEIMNRIQF